MYPELAQLGIRLINQVMYGLHQHAAGLCSAGHVQHEWSAPSGADDPQALSCITPMSLCFSTDVTTKVPNTPQLVLWHVQFGHGPLKRVSRTLQIDLVVRHIVSVRQRGAAPRSA